ncbi:unnamed protein product [Owenia fusiformis]|uniref:G-protein coupled receptors family 1 profile domain-containing protein n=1 Tax=Owenia fusiformis TaxID=6347 RepID=A0A8S4NBD7_OWEFU|nr:unnamed protein product [Owenia fusiformis]
MSDIEEFERVVFTFINPCICIFGIICNIFNLLVLTRKRLHESPYSYLTGLAVADLSTLTLTFIHGTFSRASDDTSYEWKVFDVKVYFPLANMTSTTGIFITVVLTLERFIFVRYPLHAKDICTKTIAQRAIIITYLVACLINIPLFFCMDVENKPNSTVKYQYASTAFEQSSIYHGITWFHVTTIQLIPIFILGILNICLIIIVWRAQTRRESLKPKMSSSTEYQTRDQKRLTVTLISIVILFLICFTPSVIANRHIARGIFGKGESYNNFVGSTFFRALAIVSNILVNINQSLNFILYCVFNQKFVKTMKHMVQQWRYIILHKGRGTPLKSLSRVKGSSVSFTQFSSLYIDRTPSNPKNLDKIMADCTSEKSPMMKTKQQEELLPKGAEEKVEDGPVEYEQDEGVYTINGAEAQIATTPQ